MPLVTITGPKNGLSKDQQNDMAKRIGNAVLEAEGAPINHPGAQSLVWVSYHEREEGTIYVGGESPEKPPFVIDVTTPQGALDDQDAEKMAAAIGTVIDDIVGVTEGKLNHWTMLRELQDGRWSAGGQIFRLPVIQSAMNIKAA